MAQPSLWFLWPRVLFVASLLVVSPLAQSSESPLVWSSEAWESSLRSLVALEGEKVRRTERLLTRALKNSSLLDEYLTDWRTSGFDAVVPETSEAHFLQLAKQRPLLKNAMGKSPAYLERVALSIQVASDRERRFRNNGKVSAPLTSLRAANQERRRAGGGALHPIDAYLSIKRIVHSYKTLVAILEALTVQIDDILEEQEEHHAALAGARLGLPGMRVALLQQQRMRRLSAANLSRRSPGSDWSITDVCAVGEEATCADGGETDSAVVGGERPWCLGLWDAMMLSRAALSLGYGEQAKEWLQEARTMMAGRPAEATEEAGAKMVGRPAEVTEEAGAMMAGRPAEPTEDSGGLAAERPAESIEETGVLAEERPAQSTEQSGDWATERPAESSEESGDLADEIPAESTEETGGLSAEKPADSTEEAGDLTAERPAESTEETGSLMARKQDDSAKDKKSGDISFKTLNDYDCRPQSGEGEASNNKSDLGRITRSLCSGQPLLSPEKESLLSCRLERLKSPLLLLMPLKLEELSLSPRVVLYRDFLTQKQMEYFIMRAGPELELSKLHTGLNLEIRDSLTAWIGKDESDDDHHDPHPELDQDAFLTKMNHKIAAATGLRVAYTKAAECYQVVYYGVGGHIHPHMDSDSSPGPNGDRIATFLMYLNDVTTGGWTVFPHLKVGVQPVRGTALFWHNLDSQGESNPAMLHSGCPVLSDYKWIVNKWILINEQFRTRPCPVAY